MKTTFNRARLGALALALVGATAVTGFRSNEASIGITAEVPLVCRVELAAAAGTFDDAGVAQIGATQEFCNSASGYRIMAVTQGTDDGASLIVDGRRYPVVDGQEIAIVNSVGPNRTGRSIALDAGDGEGGGRLSLRIEAR
jgi:hypothetical protein